MTNKEPSPKAEPMDLSTLNRFNSTATMLDPHIRGCSPVILRIMAASSSESLRCCGGRDPMNDAGLTVVCFVLFLTIN